MRKQEQEEQHGSRLTTNKIQKITSTSFEFRLTSYLESRSLIGQKNQQVKERNIQNFEREKKPNSQ